jgi:acetylornithine/N-succinyldiaminopimelate aminotransferase
MRHSLLDESATHSLMQTSPRPPLAFVRGEGAWLWDHNGKRYLDFIQGWAVNVLGHSPRVLQAALAEQSRMLFTPGPGYYNAPSIRLAQQLARHSCFQRVFFANSGAEANEGAIKLARKWGGLRKGGAYEIITLEHSFHGRTLATMSASGKPQFRDLFEPKVQGFPKARINDLESVERLITDRTVAVMLEPIQGEAGVIPADDSFLRDLRALTRRENLLLIVDEIQTGMGRTGTLWAHKHSGIEPDVMTLGKMLGGGVPLAALAATEAACCFEYGDQGGTLNGNPLMTAVGCAVMSAVTARGVLERVERSGRYLMKHLSALSERHSLGEVRGRGLLLALDLKRDLAPKVVELAHEAGLLINAPQPHLLRLMPALNVSQEESDVMLSILAAAVERALTG